MKILPPPGPERQRQVRLLVLLLVVMVGAWYFMWPRSTTVPVPVASNQATADAAPGTGGLGVLPEPLRLTSLDAHDEAPEVQRNLFRFGQLPAPPPPPPPPPRPQQVAPPTTPQETGPPAIPLRLVGMWDANGIRVVALSDPQTGATFQATEGMVVDGRYKLVTIQERSVIMTYLDGSGRRTIPLAGG